MRLAIEALAIGAGPIQDRLLVAEPHFGAAFDCEMSTRAAEHLRLRIGAALVEGGDGDGSVAESIALLDEARAIEIAGDMMRLYELVAGIRVDDGHGFSN